jgi:iron(II)-dependent oxidoreductase
MVLNLFSRKPPTEKAEEPARPVNKRAPEQYLPADPVKLDSDPLKQLLQQEQYGLFLTGQIQWRTHPNYPSVLKSAMESLDRQYALVPEGFVSLPQTVVDYPGCPETDIETEPFLSSTYTVTNSQFQKFVDAGGYENLELWPKDIWPHLIDLKDLTEKPGPRFWEQGRHDKRLADHPVVGVCFFEAAAYAKWAGVRLPTEAEWQMAASWRIRSSAHVLRRYPWGDALDTRRCNIWASNVGQAVPVHEYETGGAPNGVLQLVGNVWEWTDSDFNVVDKAGRPVLGDMMMRSIRGGAFDTYFPSQATSFFRTGLGVLFRVHNVGFRCALNAGNDASANN